MRFFYRWFRRWGVDLEKLVLRLAFAFLIALILGQVLMINNEIRFFLSKVEQLEGIELNETGDVLEEAIYQKEESFITLALEGEVPPGQLKVYINGEEAAAFVEPQVTVSVKPGDMLEVDGDLWLEEPVAITVVGTEGLRRPYPGEQIMWYGELELIGWAIP